MSTQPETPAAGGHAAPKGGTATAGDGNGSGAPLVKLTDVGKRYGAVIALQDINMEVSGGEVTCVLGDNGAGKSTLTRSGPGAHQHATIRCSRRPHTASRRPAPRQRRRVPGPRWPIRSCD